jgi:hypothetical protein
MKYGKKLRAKSKYTSAMATPAPTIEVRETVLTTDTCETLIDAMN